MTGTLRLAEVEIEGVRSFAEKSTVKFPYPGMVLINGQWNNSDVSSGSGKSTIPIAVAHVLDCCDIPGTVLKSWYTTKQRARVKLIDDLTGDVYDIAKVPKLELTVNGNEKEKKTGKAAEDKFREIMRAQSDLIKALTYRPQREKGRFLTRTDSENKEFLSALLNLSALEVASDDLSKESERYSLEITSLNSQITNAESTITSLSGAKAQVPDAEARYVEAQRRYNLLSGADSNTIQVRIQSLQAEIGRINTATFQSTNAQADNRSVREQVVALQAEIEKLQAQICPTCRREWDQGQSYLDSRKEKLSSLLKRMEGNISIINSAAPMQEALPKLQAELAEENRKLGQIQAPLSDAYSSMNSARMLLEQLTSQARTHDKLVQDVAGYKSRISTLAGDAEVAKHAAALLSRSGFLSVIFDDVLREIEVRTNRMIGMIPNVSTFSVQVCSSHETAKGTVKKTIAVKIFNADGNETPFKALSGGQQCALELFTDLAVSETIRKRSGSPVGWLFLDEAMDGLDVESKKAALSVIRRNVGGTVVVIDHSTEIKESFDQVIQISFDGRVSRVV